MEDGQSSEVKRSSENGLDGKRERKILVGVLAGLCVLIVVIGGIIAAINLNWTKDGSKQTTGVEEVVNEGDNGDIEKSEEESLAEYTNEMEEKIKNAETAEEKAELYMEKSKGTYVRCVEQCEALYDAILADAYKAEETYPSAETAWLIYSFEFGFGSEEKADEYREIAKERGMDVDGAW